MLAVGQGQTPQRVSASHISPWRCSGGRGGVRNQVRCMWGFGRRASPRRVPALPRAGVANPCLCSHGACCPFAMQTPMKVKSCSPRGSGFPVPSHSRVPPSVSPLTRSHLPSPPRVRVSVSGSRGLSMSERGAVMERGVPISQHGSALQGGEATYPPSPRIEPQNFPLGAGHVQAPSSCCANRAQHPRLGVGFCVPPLSPSHRGGPSDQPGCTRRAPNVGQPALSLLFSPLSREEAVCAARVGSEGRLPAGLQPGGALLLHLQAPAQGHAAALHLLPTGPRGAGHGRRHR